MRQEEEQAMTFDTSFSKLAYARLESEDLHPEFHETSLIKCEWWNSRVSGNRGTS
jgi:hypothetical protein